MKSLIQQYAHWADGTVGIKDRPNIDVVPIKQQGHVVPRNLQAELGLPVYQEEWETLAQYCGFSGKAFRCILVDESPSQLQGQHFINPAQLVVSPCYLEFAHYGFVIGEVRSFYSVHRDSRDTVRDMGVEVPDYIEGHCIVADAQLYDSRLAEKAWNGIQQGVLTHVCPIVFRQHHEPMGAGTLVEVSLTTDYFPGCLNARIFRKWEGDAV